MFLTQHLSAARTGCFLSIAAGLAITPSATASLVVGNLGAGTGNAIGVDSNARRLAAPFVLDSTFAPVVLGSITLSMRSISVPATARVTLWTGTAEAPVTQVVDLGTAIITQTGVFPDDYTFTPLAVYILQPSTTYWVMAQRTAGTTLLGWEATAPFGPILDPGSDPAATIPVNALLASSDGGASWFPTGNGSAFAVNSIPAPGACGMLATFGLLATGRRRR